MKSTPLSRFIVVSASLFVLPAAVMAERVQFESTSQPIARAVTAWDTLGNLEVESIGDGLASILPVELTSSHIQVDHQSGTVLIRAFQNQFETINNERVRVGEAPIERRLAITDRRVDDDGSIDYFGPDGGITIRAITSYLLEVMVYPPDSETSELEFKPFIQIIPANPSRAGGARGSKPIKGGPLFEIKPSPMLINCSCDDVRGSGCSPSKCDVIETCDGCPGACSCAWQGVILPD